MTDDALRAALSFDAPPARDPLFTLAVLERGARRGARRRFVERWLVWSVLAVSGLALAPAVAGWLAAPDGATLTVLTAGMALLGGSLLQRLLPKRVAAS